MFDYGQWLWVDVQGMVTMTMAKATTVTTPTVTMPLLIAMMAIGDDDGEVYADDDAWWAMG